MTIFLNPSSLKRGCNCPFLRLELIWVGYSTGGAISLFSLTLFTKEGAFTFFGGGAGGGVAVCSCLPIKIFLRIGKTRTKRTTKSPMISLTLKPSVSPPEEVL